MAEPFLANASRRRRQACTRARPTPPLRRLFGNPSHVLRPAQALHEAAGEDNTDASRQGTCPASAAIARCAARDGVDYYSFEGKRVKIKIQGQG
jgi:hypothetical protein